MLNEQALLQMVGTVHRRVRSSLAAGRFPFMYGADCSVLLAAIPALRDVDGRACLLFVDGHEDATTMDLWPSGEAANMEIALLLGLADGLTWQQLTDLGLSAMRSGGRAGGSLSINTPDLDPDR